MYVNEKKIRTGKRNFILALTLLLLTNILMGMVLMMLAKKTLRGQIEQRMLDVANVASAQINGDELKTITPMDKDTEQYQKAYNTLATFRDNIELEYIYVIALKDDGTFTFGIDPDLEDPGEYGELIEATTALQNAAKGSPDVDKVPHSDDWGRFYTAYSPFFDSDGNVVGIVGVDFNADWFDETMSSHRSAAVILTMVALTIGIALSFMIMSQNRRRFAAMLESMAELDRETKKLDSLIMRNSIKKLDFIPNSESGLLKTLAAGEGESKPAANEYDEVHTSIKSVYDKLSKYVRYIETDIDIDDTTGAKNKLAYKKRIKEVDEGIAAGNTAYYVAFFDINGIKKIYTHFGFESGDKLMFECAKLLKEVFGRDHIYHVTGDEFIAIVEGKPKEMMERYFVEFDEKVRKYNSEHITENMLSVAKGYAGYDSEERNTYRKMFVEAQINCNNNKIEQAAEPSYYDM